MCVIYDCMYDDGNISTDGFALSFVFARHDAQELLWLADDAFRLGIAPCLFTCQRSRTIGRLERENQLFFSSLPLTVHSWHGEWILEYVAKRESICCSKEV